jgi:hypothetical protein
MNVMKCVLYECEEKYIGYEYFPSSKFPFVQLVIHISVFFLYTG